MAGAEGSARDIDDTPPPDLVSIAGGAQSETGALDDRRIIDDHGQLDFDSVAVPTREQALTDAIVDLKRKAAYYKGELTKLRSVDANADTIMGRLEYWQRKCHPAAKIPISGKRWDAVKARLKDGYTAEELDAVIDIAADLPYEQYGQRYSTPGPGRVRRDELKFLLADETRVDRLLELAGSDNDARAYARFVKQACEEMPEVRSALALLATQEPHGSVLARAAVWAKAGCPRRANGSTPST